MLNPVEYAIEKNIQIWEAAIEYECFCHGKGKSEIICEMQKRFEIMKNAAIKGVSGPVSTRSGLVRGNAYKFFSSFRPEKSLTGSLVGKAIAYSLAVSEVNASMGVIVAAPTAGSCGILPGAIIALSEHTGSDDKKAINALFTASGVGILIAERATFAAAVAGCGAEIGASASITSAAIVEFMGGSQKQALHAAAISLKSYLGLVCDPVAGLVEVPCVKRNAIGVSNAFAAAEMALNGVESAIPYIEVVDAMYAIGRKLPSCLRETSKAGLATTPTALKVNINSRL